MKVGIDLISIERVGKALMQERFQKRVYTAKEIAYCQSKRAHAIESYAGIYAAKEACLKALGCGLRYGSWQDVEVDHDSLGAPCIELKGPFKERMEKLGYTNIALSITHTDDLAMAEIILFP